MTDFGIRDPFVGIMKGVIEKIAPALHVSDLTHAIPPQNIQVGAFILSASFRYFPERTLFVAVVDPGVGSARRIIYAETPKYRFLAPDNGLLGMIFDEEEPTQVVEVSNSKYFLHPTSHTFHGRDIFAPVAAYLSRGVKPEELGPTINPGDLSPLPFTKPYQDEKGEWHGEIVYIDQFGNLITNFSQNQLGLNGKETVELRVKNRAVKGLAESYTQGNGEPIVVLDSFGTLEIALFKGSAQDFLNVKQGEKVSLRCQTCYS